MRRPWKHDPQFPNCPFCGEDERVERIRSLKDTILSLVGLPLQYLLDDDRELFQCDARCRRCGCVYRGPKILRRVLDRCAQCAYSLRGNTSGVCPECGQCVPADVPKRA